MLLFWHTHLLFTWCDGDFFVVVCFLFACFLNYLVAVVDVGFRGRKIERHTHGLVVGGGGSGDFGEGW